MEDGCVKPFVRYLSSLTPDREFAEAVPHWQEQLTVTIMTFRYNYQFSESEPQIVLQGDPGDTMSMTRQLVVTRSSI